MGTLEHLAVTNNCGDGGDYKIISYEFTIIVKGTPIRLNGIGPKVRDEMRIAIGQVQKGSKVFFDNIKVSGPGGKVKNAEGITLTVE